MFQARPSKRNHHLPLSPWSQGLEFRTKKQDKALAISDISFLSWSLINLALIENADKLFLYELHELTSFEEAVYLKSHSCAAAAL